MRQLFTSIAWATVFIVLSMGCGRNDGGPHVGHAGAIASDSLAYFSLMDSLRAATTSGDLDARRRITSELLGSSFGKQAFSTYVQVQQARWRLMSMDLDDPHYASELDSMFEESKAVRDTMRMFVLLTQKVQVAHWKEKNTGKEVALMEEAMALDPEGIMADMDHTLNDRYAEACSRLEQWRKALDASLRMNRFGQKVGDPYDQYWGLLYAAEAYWKLGLSDSCDLVIEQALHVMKGSERAAKDPYAYNAIAKRQRQRGRFGDVGPLLDSTDAVLARIGSSLPRCDHCLVERVWWLLHEGEPDKAVALAGSLTRNSWWAANGDAREEMFEVLDSAYRVLGDYRHAYESRAALNSLEKGRDLTTASASMSNIENDFEQRIAEQGRRQKAQLEAIKLQNAEVARNAFIGGFAVVLFFAAVFLVQRNRIGKARKRSEELLLNILPAEVAEELKAKGEAEAVHIDHVTVLFTDFKGFTAISEVLTPKQLVRDLNECFSAFDRITEKYGIEKIKTIGDAYMAAGGLPTPNSTHAIDVINAAVEMRDFIAEGKARKVAAGLPYFEIRIGVHTGPVVAGIVGVKKFQYDIWGDTVNIASRMESSGEVGRVNISEATYELVKDVAFSSPVGSLTTDPRQRITQKAFTFIPRGRIQAKGKGEMEMYFVESTVGNCGEAPA